MRFALTSLARTQIPSPVPLRYTESKALEKHTTSRKNQRKAKRKRRKRKKIKRRRKSPEINWKENRISC
jgi:hypothetical protein